MIITCFTYNFLQLVDFLQCIQLSKISYCIRPVSKIKPSLKEGLIWDIDRLVKRTGGDDRSRTCDPLNANQVLSQLSYIPI